jgi:hypothetical protein
MPGNNACKATFFLPRCNPPLQRHVAPAHTACQSNFCSCTAGAHAATQPMRATTHSRNCKQLGQTHLRRVMWRQHTLPAGQTHAAALLAPVVPGSSAAGSKLRLQLLLCGASSSSCIQCQGCGSSSVVHGAAVALRHHLHTRKTTRRLLITTG